MKIVCVKFVKILKDANRYLGYKCNKKTANKCLRFKTLCLKKPTVISTLRPNIIKNLYLHNLFVSYFDYFSVIHRIH